MMMLTPYFVLMAMVFCHIFDDYFLQRALADMKQKSWWEEQCKSMSDDKKDLYKHDYLMALAMHSLSWSFMIMLPVSIYYFGYITLRGFIMWILNAVIHFLVDDLKANKGQLNLIQDQVIHIIQILVTFGIMLF